MMPKAVAETDAFKQIDSQIGSGPFIYVEAPSPSPARSTSTSRTPSTSRAREPASGLAGGKVVKVDRVEIIEMPDPQQQVNALIAGEIDLIEQPPHDLIPMLQEGQERRSSSTGTRSATSSSSASTMSVKPFDNPEDPPWPRCYAMRQEDYLKATVGEPEYYKVCSAAFVCGTPNAVDAPNGLLVKPDFEKAKALLKEAGYDGTPIVLMQSTDPAGADQHGAGHQVAARAGRLQGRHAVDGLADAGHAPHQEGPGRQGRLEHLPHLLGGGRHPEPDLDLLHGRAGRQVVVRLADRSGDGEAARRLRQGDRSGQGQGARRGRAGPRAGDRPVWLDRPVVRPGRRARQRRPAG